MKLKSNMIFLSLFFILFPFATYAHSGEIFYIFGVILFFATLIFYNYLNKTLENIPIKYSLGSSLFFFIINYYMSGSINSGLGKYPVVGILCAIIMWGALFFLFIQLIHFIKKKL
ncbi:MAG: hypothetical protein VX341_08805, partial [Bdellovibrionota bacterium]|nr:hypothetical protein [Bdellovibrionota bacterium]